MAIVKYGPLASEVRGSIGGTTFTAGRFGRVIRIRRSPVHSPTNRRAVYKGLLSLTVARWTGTLNQNQRDAWDTLADNTNFTNSLGETYHPTGLNLYCRTNILGRHPWVLMSWVDTAPGTAIGAHYPITYTSPGSLDIRAEMLDNPAVGHNVYFWLGLPQRPSVKYYIGPWIAFDYKVAATLYAGATEIFTPETLLHLSRYFIRDRAVYLTGEISAPYIQSVIVTA